MSSKTYICFLTSDSQIDSFLRMNRISELATVTCSYEKVIKFLGVRYMYIYIYEDILCKVPSEAI